MIAIKIAIAIILFLIGLFELLLLRASNDDRKDAEQEEYLKDWKDKKNGRC